MWKYSPKDRRLRAPVLALILMGATLSIPKNGITQILPDDTSIRPSVVIQEDTRLRIAGGTQAGANLFHSFEEFNVPIGETAYFDNAVSLENIITRVTGDRRSAIDGTIRTNGVEAQGIFQLEDDRFVLGRTCR